MTRNNLFSINNIDTFLLDISIPIINFLEGDTSDFDATFKSACWDNRLFASWHVAHPANPVDNKETEIFQLTDDFLSKLDHISEYVGCECHDKPVQEYHQELTVLIKEYIAQLLSYIKLAQISEDLKKEYEQVIDELLNERVAINAAEEALWYWKDALSDITMQNIMVNLRYTYIKNQLFPKEKEL